MSRVRDLYERRLDEGRLERDVAQERVIDRLDRLADELTAQSAPKSGPFGWFAPKRPAAESKGIYIYGAVGRGKTMLMDLFFEAVAFEPKRRIHFHAFMRDVHAHIYEWRQKRRVGQARGDDPIAPVAEAIASEARLLCFDELFVTDITDAMVLGRLFTQLFQLGVVLVVTSNVPPSRLYENGLNRSLFLPFVSMLESWLDVIELKARTDFRLEKLSNLSTWLVPADLRANAALDRTFKSLTGSDRGEPVILTVFGRDVVAPHAAENVARFSFAELCEQPLGPADYLEIARRFHTLLIDRIPVMGFRKRNEARRFIWLVDALYDMKVKLIASAEAQPDELFRGGGREAFEFARAASRLIEMRSQDYLALPHGRPSSEASGESTGLVET